MGFKLNYTGDEINRLLSNIESFNKDISPYIEDIKKLDDIEFRLLSQNEYNSLSMAEKRDNTKVYIIGGDTGSRVISDYKAGVNMEITDDGTIYCGIDTSDILRPDEIEDLIKNLKVSNDNDEYNHVNLFYKGICLSSLDLNIMAPIVYTVNYLLHHVRSSVNNCMVMENGYFENRLLVDDGYILDAITVEMANEDGVYEDITNSCYFKITAADGKVSNYIKIKKITGNIIITATAVPDADLCESIEVSSSSLTIRSLDGCAIVHATTVPDYVSRHIKWTSANSAIAEVVSKEQSGFIVGKSVGTTTITASCGAASANVKVKVTTTHCINVQNLPPKSELNPKSKSTLMSIESRLGEEGSLVFKNEEYEPFGLAVTDDDYEIVEIIIQTDTDGELVNGKCTAEKVDKFGKDQDSGAAHDKPMDITNDGTWKPKITD